MDGGGVPPDGRPRYPHPGRQGGTTRGLPGAEDGTVEGPPAGGRAAGQPVVRAPAGRLVRDLSGPGLGRRDGPGAGRGVVRGRVADYDDRDIDEGAFGIVIEVADSSLDMDRRAKGGFYARAGLPVYWVVNVLHRQVAAYTGPDPGADPPAYRARTDYRPGDDVPITLDGQLAGAIPALDLLP
ncbi:MAG: Uma2 family endonuclease [Gemmataceae bacterium]|nr:Uma2 family endonuclease [Gemmataceae bacterium]